MVFNLDLIDLDTKIYADVYVLIDRIVAENFEHKEEIKIEEILEVVGPYIPEIPYLAEVFPKVFVKWFINEIWKDEIEKTDFQNEDYVRDFMKKYYE